MKNSFPIQILLLLAVACVASAAPERDSISIVGSSTVYPFTAEVAKHFSRDGRFKPPTVDSTGTGGGFKLFCGGVGKAFPDISDASRRIKQTEFETCARNGVKEIAEIEVGYDGIALAHSRKGAPLSLTRREIYLALAKEIPNPANPQTLIVNPNRTWKQVDSSLPDMKITVLGPPPTSGTRDAFGELVLDVGCDSYPWIKSLQGTDPDRFKRVCQTLREDGAYVETGENDDLTVQQVEADPTLIGIFGYSYLEENRAKLAGSLLEGVGPTFETIASGKYPASRPLFIYVKKAQVGLIPGIPEFIAEYVSEAAFGEGGYLDAIGLIPLRDSERGQVRADARALKSLELSPRQDKF